MKIKNTQNEIIISIPKGLINQKDIQDLLDFFRYRTLLCESKANDQEINEIMEDIDKDMRESNQIFLKSI